MITKKLISVCFIFMLSACTYLKYSGIQAEYKMLQKAEPSQVNLKHMIDRETFYVWGKPIDKAGEFVNKTMAIAAYSSKFKSNERVDIMFFKGTITHYGLNLPEGVYTLLIYADKNDDQVFQENEVVGMKSLELDIDKYPEKIIKNIDITLINSLVPTWAETIAIPSMDTIKQSLFYPSGTIRSLSDPVFDERISTMGMYDPASFMKYAPTMFYALDEDVVHKIPVVFVHGIGGSARAFQPIIDKLDSERYRPWFFYYPSGGDLDQLASFFYNVFLSGEVVPLGEMPMIVVAHSMGGLVVREAINHYQGEESENKVELLVTIASPFGGHPSAPKEEELGVMVLPSWKDLYPQSQFIQGLYRKPLPPFVNHQLIYAYKNSNKIKLGENSDGVVPLSSQLYSTAQMQSQRQFGFNSSHDEILANNEMIDNLLENMAEVKGIFPESHMRLFVNGGFDVQLGDEYSPNSQHLIGYAGKYIVLLVEGVVEPINQEQQHFIDAVQGKVPATKNIEREFIKFTADYPDLVKEVISDNNKVNTNNQLKLNSG